MIFCDVMPSRSKVKAASSSEISTPDYQTKRRHIPYDPNVNDLINALLGNSSVNMFQHKRHATSEEAIFSMWSVLREYKIQRSSVEAVSNTSTMALRDVGGDKKETQCLGI
jgi:hypothetical protein